VTATADALLRGQTLKVDDPNAVAEVIDELNARRIEALQADDYKTGKAIENVIASARLQFRLHDRDVLHREIVARLEERWKNAVETANGAKDIWKRKRATLAEIHRQELMDLVAKHEMEHQQLEGDWVQPEMVRKFDKRSSSLLQNRQIEQYMLLSGDLMGADQMKRINAQTEKVELQVRHREMAGSFEVARANLMAKQATDVDRLRFQQEGEMKWLGESERKDLAVKARRVEATQKVLTEEKDYSNFMTKKFRKSADIVVPATVAPCREVGGDLPPLARGKSVPPGVASMMEIRKRIPVSRLPLGPLAVKHYQPPSLVKAVKKHSS
jgi:hypothetical protein